MKKKQLHITGGTGLIALNWACALRSTSDVTLGTHQHSFKFDGVGAIKLILTDPVSCQAQLAEMSFDLVAHTAGLASVDKCELSIEIVNHASIEIAQNVALAVTKHGSALVQISTDYLFTGQSNMCTEAELPSLLNQFVRTKALAEKVVMTANPVASVLRTNFLGRSYSQRQSLCD